MTIKSLDIVKQELEEKLAAAMQGEDPNAITQVLAEFASNIKEDVMQDFEAFQKTQDKTILAKRGVRQLTEEEKKFYQAFGEAVKSSDPKMSFTGLDVAMPFSIIDTVLEDIKSSYPLLAAINIQNTATITKMIINKTGVQLAVWGALNSTITNELNGAIGEIDVNTNKLTAFMAVSLDMIDAGPEWMDAYVRAVLVEANGGGICKAIVAGTGKDEPIGMIRDVSDNVTITGGVYPLKATVPISDLSPKTIGSIAKVLASGPNNRSRVVPKILIVVSPTEYFDKIMPATTYLTPNGTYVNNVLPYPSDIIQDVNVPAGQAIFGLASRYFMGVGKGGQGGQITYSDEFRFLDDQRVYKTKLLGNGRPLDNNAFVVADITGLTPINLKVNVGTVDSVVKTKEQA
jgi:hypothetical protein